MQLPSSSTRPLSPVADWNQLHDDDTIIANEIVVKPVGFFSSLLARIGPSSSVKDKTVLGQIKQNLKETYPNLKGIIDDHVAMVLPTSRNVTGKELKALKANFDAATNNPIDHNTRAPAPSHATASKAQATKNNTFDGTLNYIVDTTINSLEGLLAKHDDLTSKEAQDSLKQLSKNIGTTKSKTFENSHTFHNDSDKASSKPDGLYFKWGQMPRVIGKIAENPFSPVLDAAGKREVYRTLLKACIKQLQLLRDGNHEAAKKMDAPITMYQEMALYPNSIEDLENFYKRDMADKGNYIVDPLKKTVHPSRVPPIPIYGAHSRLLSQKEYYANLKLEANRLMTEIES